MQEPPLDRGYTVGISNDSHKQFTSLTLYPSTATHAVK